MVKRMNRVRRQPTQEAQETEKQNAAVRKEGPRGAAAWSPGGFRPAQILRDVVNLDEVLQFARLCF